MVLENIELIYYQKLIFRYSVSESTDNDIKKAKH